MTKKDKMNKMVLFPDYKKTRSVFRHYILGKVKSDKRYLDVLRMMALIEKYHTGKRKNGEAELSHQYAICAYLMTIEDSLEDPVSCYVVALAHDLYEDYPESEKELRELFAKYVEMIIRISKIRNGIAIDKFVYFNEMALCMICSIVKLCDRFHNFSTMVEPFNREKQLSYLEDLDDFFLPLLKEAKRRFPEQTAAYENLKFVLTTIRNVLLLTFLKEESSDCHNK